ncbi:MAG: PIN domain-containing protein [Lamprocystis purpurea]|nr:PIN domain-containing protein [Lamprocystis purpurea]
MPESVFIDTGYILALVNENDQHHAEALVLSQRYDGQPVVITDAVLLEIGNALSRMDRTAAVQIIQDLRDASEATLVSLTPELFESAFLRGQATDCRRGRGRKDQPARVPDLGQTQLPAQCLGLRRPADLSRHAPVLSDQALTLCAGRRYA